jgi:hypothetical protein
LCFCRVEDFVRLGIRHRREQLAIGLAGALVHEFDHGARDAVHHRENGPGVRGQSTWVRGQWSVVRCDRVRQRPPAPGGRQRSDAGEEQRRGLRHHRLALHHMPNGCMTLMRLPSGSKKDT